MKILIAILWALSLFLMLFAFDTSFSKRNYKLEWSELGLENGKCLMFYKRIDEGSGKLNKVFCVGNK